MMDHRALDHRALDHRALDSAGARFVHVLGSLFREASTGRLPSVGLTHLNEAAWRLVELLGATRVVVEPGGAWVNDHLVHIPEPLWGSRDTLAEALGSRGVGGIAIEGVAEVDEWTGLMRVLLTAAPGDPEACITLNTLLGEGPLRLLPLSRHSVEGVGEVTDLGTRALRHQATASWAVGLYLRCLRAMRATLDSHPPAELPELVQELLELCEDSPRHLLAFVTGSMEAPYALRHPVNTTILSLLLGRALGLTHGACLDLGLAAMACDVGMSRVPPAVLRARRALTEDEVSLIQRHPLHSALEALSAPQLDTAACRRIRVCLEQHMEPGGEGYPSLPHWGARHLFSRIIGVADSYGAMVSDQPWRPGMLPDRALDQLLKESGRRVETALVARFAQLVGRYPVGTTVLLQTGELGVVYSPPESEDHHLRPVVRLLTGEKDRLGPEVALVDLREKSPAGVYRRTIVRSVSPGPLGIDVLQALFGGL